MIYGLGTGRCGTRSLATDLYGVHEPEPWVGGDTWAAYWGDAEARTRLKARFAARARLDTLIVVDLHQSVFIPLILEVDPAASFIWMIRHPHDCIASMLAGGWWTERNRHGANQWRPQEGWPEGTPRLDKAITYWLGVNTIIEADLHTYQPPWRRRLTTSLRAHENRYPPQFAYRLTADEAATIEDACGAPWQRWQQEVAWPPTA